MPAMDRLAISSTPRRMRASGERSSCEAFASSDLVRVDQLLDARGGIVEAGCESGDFVAALDGDTGSRDCRRPIRSLRPAVARAGASVAARPGRPRHRCRARSARRSVSDPGGGGRPGRRISSASAVRQRQRDRRTRAASSHDDRAHRHAAVRRPDRRCVRATSSAITRIQREVRAEATAASGRARPAVRLAARSPRGNSSLGQLGKSGDIGGCGRSPIRRQAAPASSANSATVARIASQMRQ